LDAIRENVTEILQNLPADVLLVSAAKTRSAEEVKAAIHAGIQIVGYNYVQEAERLRQTIDEPVKWHMIGHLQRNKVKYIIDKVNLIHSVDSYRLAETISKEAKKKNVDAHILIQVNVAQEDSKYGLETTDVKDMIKSIRQLEHLKIDGLMTIAPFVDDPEENRPIFKALYQLSVDIKEQNLDNVSMDVLSMGMTNDLEEGSTMIRIGTALFGDRN